MQPIVKITIERGGDLSDFQVTTKFSPVFVPDFVRITLSDKKEVVIPSRTVDNMLITYIYPKDKNYAANLARLEK